MFLWLVVGRSFFFLLLALLCGAPCLWTLWRAARANWLARHGQSAAGAVTRITTRRGATPSTTVYRVFYSFQDQQGRPFTGKLCSTRATNWMFYDGKPVEVRYAPRDPRRNTLTSI
ncbi:DUF3592 domain-containing protein [Mycobacterium kyorinense]|uniref:DUF3592 domain-containing protein n=1 Tax=Mycobacterium kyorinense TaxID=487514 RepID=UPI001151886D|nr:DUF3592 domain-containing protein [Mycobacterium kyorinense]